jgi:hypothetical protein
MKPRMKPRTRRTRLPFWQVMGLSLLGLFAFMCKKDEPVEYPPSQPQTLAPDAGTQGAPPPADAAAPPSDAGPQPLDPVTAQALAFTIAERAKQDAKGMQTTGELMGAVLSEGGKIESAVMLESGKCYAVVASGGPGIVELDLEIQAKPSPSLPLPGPVIAVDSGSGSSASITPCYKNVFPLPFAATLVVKATRGGGAVGAQLYVK